MQWGISTSPREWLQKTTTTVGRSKKYKQLISSAYTIPLLVLVCFFVSSLGIGGPAYMSDEIGYLSKASTIAGSTVHLHTSWFAGYSFMISPAFLFSSNPYTEWNIILVLNAVMWAGSAALLRYILKRTHPKATHQAIFLATLGAMLYPAWLSMSGYAFATSGFVFVFMAALAALLKSNFTHTGWLAIAALCVGYLCWIHPLGFLFLGLFIVTLLSKAILTQKYKMILVPVISAVVAVIYLLVVQPWINHAMSGGLADSSHYTAGASGILQEIPSLQYWIQTGLLFVGLLFFTVIATFGLAIYGSIEPIKHFVRKRRKWKEIFEEPEALVMLMSVTIVLGVICFTAFSWGATKQLRIDQWIYGRYTDMYVLPLIGFGLLASWRSKQAFKLAGLVIVAGVLLSLTTNPENTLYAYINKINLQSFWPIHLPVSIRTENYWVWGIFGAVGIAICGLMGTAQRKKYLVLLLVPIFLAGAGNYMYQYRIVHGYASPSTLYQYIKDNYSTTDCIGFTPDSDNNERFNLYSYYLHGYNVRKITIDQWQKQDCKGLYLTYDDAAVDPAMLQIIGIEAKSGLHVITKTKDNKLAQDTIIFD